MSSIVYKVDFTKSMRIWTWENILKASENHLCKQNSLPFCTAFWAIVYEKSHQNAKERMDLRSFNPHIQCYRRHFIHLKYYTSAIHTTNLTWHKTWPNLRLVLAVMLQVFLRKHKKWGKKNVIPHTKFIFSNFWLKTFSIAPRKASIGRLLNKRLQHQTCKNPYIWTKPVNSQ